MEFIIAGRPYWIWYLHPDPSVTCQRPFPVSGASGSGSGIALLAKMWMYGNNNWRSSITCIWLDLQPKEMCQRPFASGPSAGSGSGCGAILLAEYEITWSMLSWICYLYDIRIWLDLLPIVMCQRPFASGPSAASGSGCGATLLAGNKRGSYGYTVVSTPYQRILLCSVCLFVLSWFEPSWIYSNLHPCYTIDPASCLTSERDVPAAVRIGTVWNRWLLRLGFNRTCHRKSKLYYNQKKSDVCCHLAPSYVVVGQNLL